MAYLPAPARTLIDHQVEYAGLLLGPGTPFDLPPVWTFLDSPPVKTSDTSRPAADGSWAGADYADIATWQMPVEIAAEAGVAFPAAVAQLRNAFVIAKQSRPLWVKIPGFAVQGVRARTGQRSLPIDLGFGKGYVAGAVQWRAPNPVWQSVPRTVLLAPSTGAAGLAYPLFTPYGSSSTPVLDYGIATAAPSAAALSNNGNTDAPPVAVISGPTSGGFQVTVDGHIVAYSDALAAGDTVTIDWATGRAYLSASGSASVDRTYLLTARDFAGVVPAGGTATATFAASGGTAAITTADLWR